MNRGILIVAHDNEQISYSTISVISARLARKHLATPVSLVTDSHTLENLKSNFDVNQEFDKIIVTEKPESGNIRTIDGKVVDNFLNFNRPDVFRLTPYDKTLLIDSDLLIYTDRFNQYWEIDQDVILCESMIDHAGHRLEDPDLKISDIGPRLKWATAIMFDKSPSAEIFFDLVKHIKENYVYYSDIYNFIPFQYRNDIAFTIAEHMLYCQDTNRISLPPLNFSLQEEKIISVKDSKFKLLLKGNDSILTIQDSDIHLMNKLDILNFKDELLS